MIDHIINPILGLMKSILFSHLFHTMSFFVDYFHIELILIVLVFSSDTIEVNVELIIETIHIMFVDMVVMLCLKKRIFILSSRFIIKRRIFTIKNKI
jgi:hypothetical protein